MNNKKFKFNFVDVIIILIIIAAAVILAGVFIGRDATTAQPQTTVSKIQYVIELQDVDDRFDGMIDNGQAVQDAIERKNLLMMFIIKGFVFLSIYLLYRLTYLTCKFI